MVKKHYNKTLDWIDRKRYHLLLFSTLLVLILPAYSGSGFLSKILFWVTMTFLFLQSLVAADVKKSRKQVIRVIVIVLILLTWLQPLDFKSIYLDIFRNAAFAAFFIHVVTYLFRFVFRSEKVNLNVLITSVNIYLLLGIIGGCLAWLLFRIYPDAYNFPDQTDTDSFTSFIYYSFITMSTVGYGDITPRIPETQTLAYFLAITGQLYVAIIIAFIVGKFMSHTGDERVILRRKKHEQNPE